MRSERTALLGGALAACAAFSPAARADMVYLEPPRFVEQALGEAAAPAFLWLTPALQAGVRAILGHPYGQARVRYWRRDDRYVWVLDEIGKEFPITAGFVVDAGALAQARVLVYRESRGQEISNAGFLAQFEGARLKGQDASALTRRIDGITGATMSVDAMDRMARLALWFTAQVRAQEQATK